MVAERKEHVFKELAAEDPDQQPMEIESFCVSCGENGVTRLLLTKIPHYKEIILMSFNCDHCGMQNNEIQSGGKIQEQGVKFRVLIQTERDLSRQVVKSDFATVTVPEIELEIPANSQKGEVTTVEGVLRRTITGLEQDQPVRRALAPEDAEKIDSFIKRIEDLLNLNQPFHIELSDPSGNSFMENLHAPRSDPAREVSYFNRTPEQDRMLGIYREEELREAGGGASSLATVDEEEEKADQACATLASPSITSTASSTSPLLQAEGGRVVPSTSSKGEKIFGAKKDEEATVECERSREDLDAFDEVLESYSENPSAVDDLRNEVLSFPTNCPDCNAPASTNMKVTSIPHFKEVVIMATVCDYCGHKTNEVKSGGGIEPKGQKITLRVTEASDLSRDVLKSETCGLLIPELDLEMGSHAFGGKFTTLEGLLRNIQDQIEQHPVIFGMFGSGDSGTEDEKKRLAGFKERLNRMIEGEEFPFTVVLDDPSGNSYLQNVYAPEEDPEMKIERYDRSWQQNEELGLNDMKVEGYEAEEASNDSAKNREDGKPSHAEAQHLVE